MLFLHSSIFLQHSKKNILQNSNSTDAIPNSHMPSQLSMSSTAINLGSGLVSVDYETREGNARSSQDFQPVSGTLVGLSMLKY